MPSPADRHLTYPHIGNYGVNDEDVEASRVHAAGLIIKDLPLLASNFRKTVTLSEYLQREGTVAIADIDTRALTRRLRTHGAQNGCILALAAGDIVTDELKARAVAAAKAAPSMAGLDLAKVVSAAASYQWTQSEWQLARADGTPGYGEQTAPRFHVVAYDFGVKYNILRMLAERGCKVTVVPAQTPTPLRLPDGVFLSNGPGDGALRLRSAAAAELIETGVPTFGVALGTRSWRWPVVPKPSNEVQPPRCQPSSQGPGHGPRQHHQPEPVAVDEKTLPANLRPRISCLTARCKAWPVPTSPRSAGHRSLAVA